MFKAGSKHTEAIEAIAAALASLPIGETLSYATMSKLVGAKITSQSYIVQRALRKAEARTGALFENVMATGYQRIATGDIPEVGKRANTRIRKQARRTRKRLESIRSSNMTAREFAHVAAYRAHFAMIEGLAREQTIQTTAKKLEGAGAPIEPESIASRLATMMRK